MKEQSSLEELHRRFETLVLHRSDTFICEVHRQSIMNKFANKSLQELSEIAHQLKPIDISIGQIKGY